MQRSILYFFGKRGESMINLIICVAPILCALALGDTIVSLFFYAIYRFDGGRKSFRDYHYTMSNLNMDDWEQW